MRGEEIFCDIAPTLDAKNALLEASRCYYCYDAPCIRACPTGIDIPSFIRKIGNGNLRGAAMDILSANIMGGTCSRVCPVETLCQQACVREKAEEQPVQIGALQRYATDELFKSGEQPFERAASNGKKIAVVGAGPAGLSCAHKLATLGYTVTVYEAREKSGGLNEYGIAPYKVADDWAQREVDFILSVGGIEVRHGQALGTGGLSLAKLRGEYSAVFLGFGLGGNNALGVPGDDLPGVIPATRQIENIRQSRDLGDIHVARNVVVIGGGNTAIDIAIQMKRLGAEFVTLVYRRGTEQMGATWHERELAQKEGVLIKTWARPSKIEGTPNGVTAVEFEYTEAEGGKRHGHLQGKLQGTGRFFKLPAEQVFAAIGQTLAPKLDPALNIHGGKVAVNEGFETSVPGVFAGGDCVGPGEDLTVTAVQQGKLAALAIHRKLEPTSTQTPAQTPAKTGANHG